MVSESTSQRQNGEIDIDHGQESPQHDSLKTESVNSGEEDLIDIHEDDSAGLVLFDKDHELLEPASSILKCAPDEESFGALVTDAGSKAFGTVSIDRSDSSDKLHHSQMNNSTHDERLFIDVEEGHEEISSDTEDDKADENELGPNLESSERSLCQTSDINQNVLCDYSSTKMPSLANDSNIARSAFSEPDPSIATDPLRDRRQSPSKALDFDESKFDNTGIDVVDFHDKKTSQESVEQGSTLSLRRNDLDSDENERGDGYEREVQSIESVQRLDELELKTGLSLNSYEFAAGNEDDLLDSIDSHHISLDFSEESEAETVSTTSDDGESLWSLFPQYFRPSGHLMHSSNNSVDFSLAEEDQYEDGENSETERGVALLSVKVLSARDESSPNIGSRDNETIFLDNCDELSTASSESLEETYEVNAEIHSESEEVSEDSGYVNSKENGKSSRGEIHNKVEETSSSSPNISRHACRTNICEISPANFCNDALLVAETRYTLDCDQYTEEQFLENFKSTEMLKGSEVPSHLSDALVKHTIVGNAEILSNESFSPKNLDDRGTFVDRSYSPSDWIIPSPPTPTPELQDTDIPIVSPPPLSTTPDGGRLEELMCLIVPLPPTSVDILPNISGIKIASPPPLDLSDSELERLMDDYDDVKFLSLTDDHKLAKTNGLVSIENYDTNFTEDKKLQVKKVAADLPMTQKESPALLNRKESIHSPAENLSKSNQSRAKNFPSTFTSHIFESHVSPDPPSACVPSTFFGLNTGLKCDKDSQKQDDVLDKGIVKGSENLDISIRNDKSIKTELGASPASDQSTQKIIEQCRRFPSKQKPPVPPKPRIFRSWSVSGEKTVSLPKNSTDGKATCKLSTTGARYPRNGRLGSIANLSPVKSSNMPEVTSTKNIDHSLRQVIPSCNQTIMVHSQQKSSPPTSIGQKDDPSRTEIKLRREKLISKKSLSFTFTSPYVPAPYSTSRMQHLTLTTSPTERLHGLTRCKDNNNFCAGNSSGASERNCVNAVHFQGPIVKPASPLHKSCRNSRHPSRNLSGDDPESTFLKQRNESSDQHQVDPEHHEEKCNSTFSPSPLPDSPPPPLPKSSPPATIPSFDLEDFDNGEPLIETFCDDALNYSVESNTSPDLTSLNKDLKFKLSSDSVEKSRSGYFERRDGDSALSASLTSSSLCRERRSLSEDWSAHSNSFFLNGRTKRRSVAFEESSQLDDDVAKDSSHKLEEFQIKAFRAKSYHVCEEGLSKVNFLMNRLELCLNKTALNAQTNGENRNWLLNFQNNARFLACDVKVISSSIKRGSPQVVSAVKTSLDSLEKVVESCENTYSMLNDTCDRNGRHIVAMVKEVVEQYRDILCTVKATSFQQPDNPDVEVLVIKTNALTTLIDSVIRALRRH